MSKYYGVFISCVCPDGVTRRVEVLGDPDTAFSMPGRVNVRHRMKRYTVRGFITPADGMAFMQDHEPKYLFHPYKYRKNGHVFDMKIAWQREQLDKEA